MTSPKDGGNDEGTLVFDPEEPILTFFLKLPEPLSVPEFTVFRERIHASALPMGWLEEETEAEHQPGKRDYTNTWVLGSSIIVHHVKTSLTALTGLDAIVKAAVVGIKGPEHRGVQLPLDQSADCTVLEVAIPVWVNLLAYRDRIKLDPSVKVRDLEGVPDEYLDFLLEVAIEKVRNLQMAYHAVRNSALTLLTAELLPPFVPYLVRKSQQIADREEVELRFYHLQRSFNFITRGEDLSEDRIRMIYQAGGQIQQNPLAAYLDLDREAFVALRRAGNTRVSVVMVAAACEVLLDRTLLMMNWEEKKTPETVASAWRESLKRRVELDFPGRIGGSWDLTTDGPVGRWAKKVAQIRNRVVHGGYMPSRAEAEDALTASHDLVTFIGDRLTYHGNMKKYPRSAMLLLGNEGLNKRGRYTKALRELQKDPREPQWDETFGRWFKAFARLRGDALVSRGSSLENSSLMAVYFPHRWPVCVAHDDSTGQAAEVMIPDNADLGLGPGLVLQIFEEHSKGPDWEVPTSVLLVGGVVDGVTRAGEWVEEYHLVPLRSVMVDRSDLTAPTS